MAAIINIFHLLPHPAAGVFLDEVVKMVVDVSPSFYNVLDLLLAHNRQR